MARIESDVHGASADLAIAWRPWGAAAFEEAARGRRPVLLRLSASWCHWCHVQEQGPDADPRVVDAAAAGFVPVRVDIDKRPDLRERFTMGGYPTTAILTARGEILTGATYLPADEFLRLLDAGLAAHRNGAVLPLSAKAAPRARGAAVDRRAALEAVGRSMVEAYDWVNHGFGLEPKFPQPVALQFLLAAGLRTGLRHGTKAALLSFSAIPKTELYDPIDGGFFRFCAGATWTEPHFEKMLGANAELLQAFAAAAGWGKRDEERRVARELAAYLERALTLPSSSLWGGSQAADEEYYAKMGHARRARGAPPVDPVVYTDWNSKAISAFAVAGLALDEPRLISRARIALAELLDAGVESAGAVHHYRDAGGWRIPGLLRDRVFLATAALDVYCATGERRWLDRAVALAMPVASDFGDGEGGGLVDVAKGHRAKDEPPLPPNRFMFENGAAAMLFFRLAESAGKPELRQIGERMVNAVAPSAKDFGVFAAPVGLALLACELGVVVVTSPPVRIESPQGALVRSALAQALALGPVAIRLDEGLKAPGRPLPVSYCAGDRCSAPVAVAAELPSALRSVVPVTDTL